MVKTQYNQSTMVGVILGYHVTRLAKYTMISVCHGLGNLENSVNKNIDSI